MTIRRYGIRGTAVGDVEVEGGVELRWVARVAECGGDVERGGNVGGGVDGIVGVDR